MSVKYSYDDYTTKGHGVIEYYSTGSKRKRRKPKGKLKPSDRLPGRSKNANTFKQNYSHLLFIHQEAQAKRKREQQNK